MRLETRVRLALVDFLLAGFPGPAVLTKASEVVHVLFPDASRPGSTGVDFAKISFYLAVLTVKPKRTDALIPVDQIVAFPVILARLRLTLIIFKLARIP